MSACKATSNTNEVVFGKEKGVELLVMDTIDPYVVESDRDGNSELFGDAVAAAERLDGEGTESCELAGAPAATEEGCVLPRPTQPSQFHLEDHRAFGHVPYRS